MAEIRFYHLQKAQLEDVLTVILERAYQRGNRILVLTDTEERAENLSHHLWIYSPDSFLPHGTKKDGDSSMQPIYLTSEPVNSNRSDILILTEGVDYPNSLDFKLICNIFDGNDERILNIARAKWKLLKEAGHTLVYYQQSASGKWEEQARAGES